MDHPYRVNTCNLTTVKGLHKT